MAGRWDGVQRRCGGAVPGRRLCGAAVELLAGDLQCAGAQPQVCGDAGTWQNNGSFCDPRCGDACDPATASPCVGFSEGTSCDDHDVCAGPGQCLHGACVSAGGGSDHEWAHWDLAPDAAPPVRYLYSSTSTVVYDNLTHLTWQRYVPAAAYTWDDAKSYCDCLSGASNEISCDGDKIAGYPDGWRLPTSIELASVVAYARAEPPIIDGDAFPDTPIYQYWSSSPLAGTPGIAWSVNFSGGFMNLGTMPNDGSTFSFRVRCVHGGGDDVGSGGDAGCPERYTCVGGGTLSACASGAVLDLDTRLTWQQRIEDTMTYSWSDASPYCEGLQTLGGGWRLPSAFELQTLIDRSQFHTLDTVAFPGPMSETDWSSSPDESSPGTVWYVEFTEGFVGYDFSSGSNDMYNVRCVR